MSNFLSYDDALAIIGDVGLKKLTIVESMPTASADYEGISYLYVGATTANFTNGAVYKCQEVTPATDPKTYEWVWKVAFNTAVDNAFSDSSTNALQNKIITGKFTDEDAEIADIVNVYGSKNLNCYPYNETTKTENGATFTDNGDGTITVNKTSASSDIARFYFHSRIIASSNKLILPNGKYIVSGCPSGGSGSTYYIAIGVTKNNSYVQLGIDTGNGCEITVDGDDSFTDKAYINLNFIIPASVTISNKVIKPMIKLASIEDDTYVPYADTNKGLTDRVAALEARLDSLNAITYGG